MKKNLVHKLNAVGDEVTGIVVDVGERIYLEHLPLEEINASNRKLYCVAPGCHRLVAVRTREGLTTPVVGAYSQTERSVLSLLGDEDMGPKLYQTKIWCPRGHYWGEFNVPL